MSAAKASGIRAGAASFRRTGPGRVGKTGRGDGMRVVRRADHLRPRGPIPKWCSATYRHRAWEQARAAASGRAAVEVVEVVERIVVTPVTRPVVATPRHNDWIELLRELSRQLDRGVVYDRDLPRLAPALEEALIAFQRRLRHR